MSWKSSITKIEKGEIRLRGYDITELMGQLSFAEAVYLTLKGELPDEKEAKMMDALLVSSIDHASTPPSSQATRLILSGGNSLNSAIAAGILTIGESHGGAIEQCAKILQENAIQDDDSKIIAKDIVMSIKYFVLP